MNIAGAIAKALARVDLSRDEAAAVFGEIMDGAATPAQIGGLLVALRAKGEAVDELVGAATAMRARATPLAFDASRAIDTCGTGGDGAGTINVSTLAAILIAACGGTVAKHGNRAQSSKCGSADVLEALGVAIDREPAVIERQLAHAGIAFMFAPRFHAATRHAAGPRKELGTRTIFNLLGPLTNPARVGHQVVGVYDRAWCTPMAAALGALGVRRAAVVHGAGGPNTELGGLRPTGGPNTELGGLRPTGGPNTELGGLRPTGGIDELAVAGETHVAIFDGGSTSMVTLSPASFDVREVDPAGLAGGDAAHNAEILHGVLAGRQISVGERHHAVLVAAAMTAALGLALLELGALDLATLPAHYERAAATVRDGSALRVLDRWREATA